MNPLTGECLVANGEDVLAAMDINSKMTVMQDVYVLLSIFLAFKIANFFCLKYLNQEKR